MLYLLVYTVGILIVKTFPSLLFRVMPNWLHANVSKNCVDSCSCACNDLTILLRQHIFASLDFDSLLRWCVMSQAVGLGAVLLQGQR